MSSVYVFFHIYPQNTSLIFVYVLDSSSCYQDIKRLPDGLKCIDTHAHRLVNKIYHGILHKADAPLPVETNRYTVHLDGPVDLLSPSPETYAYSARIDTRDVYADWLAYEAMSAEKYVISYVESDSRHVEVSDLLQITSVPNGCYIADEVIVTNWSECFIRQSDVPWDILGSSLRFINDECWDYIEKSGDRTDWDGMSDASYPIIENVLFVAMDLDKYYNNFLMLQYNNRELIKLGHGSDEYPYAMYYNYSHQD